MVIGAEYTGELEVGTAPVVVKCIVSPGLAVIVTVDTGADCTPVPGVIVGAVTARAAMGCATITASAETNDTTDL